MPPGDSVSQKNLHCVAGSLYGVHFCVVSCKKVFCQETRQASPCRETGDSHMQIETENKTALQSSGVPGSLTMGDGEVAVIGIDIGSTTAKIVVFCGEAGCPAGSGRLVYSCYERHFSQVRPKTLELLRRVQPLVGNRRVRVAISGSAGLGLARAANIPFVQEVFATAETVRRLEPDTSAVIELGGEDAKIIFFDGGLDERMNGTCAGGTGAFIDQMATLLDLTIEEMDELSLRHTRIYPIASRCGVFAKTDIQPLLNQGAAKENIAASIYAAVASQTIAGLAQGRRIGGKVMSLGGPLYYWMTNTHCSRNTVGCRSRWARHCTPPDKTGKPIWTLCSLTWRNPAAPCPQRRTPRRCSPPRRSTAHSANATTARPPRRYTRRITAAMLSWASTAAPPPPNWF